MKNKKNIVLLIGIITFLVGCVMIILSCTKLYSKEITNYDKPQILNLQQTTQEIPNFSIIISGAYSGFITKDLITNYNIKIYEFDAVIDNGWGYVKNHYVGFRLLDVLNTFEMTDFASIKFTSEYRIELTQLHSSLTNDIFIIVTKDNKELDEISKVRLLNVDKGYRYSLEGLQGMNFEAMPKLDDIQTDDTEEDNKDNQ